MSVDDKSIKSDADVEKIVQAIIGDRRDDIVILFIPSHDKSRPQKRLNNQDQWAQSGLELMGDLYGGATAFKALKGVWLDDDGTRLFDEPIQIESLAQREQVLDRKRLHELMKFIHRLGKETNQSTVGVIFNDVIFFVSNW